MKIPSNVHCSLGNQSIRKGDVAGQLRFYAWDAVTPCTGRICPAFMSCTYPCRHEVEVLIEDREKGLEIEMPRCGIMLNYLTSIIDIVFRNYVEELSEAQLYRIGMGLVPSYRQLCRLKIEELGTENVCYTNLKGERKLNPIFNAIRDQIIAIERIWQSIGLNKLDDLDLSKNNNAYQSMQDEAIRSMKKVN